VGAIEGAYTIKYANLQSFSEQQVTSCDTGNGGCNGGWPDSAMKWVGTNGGLSTEAAYPYASASGNSPACKKSVTKDPKAKVVSTVQVGNNFAAMKAALAKGPVSIALAASSSVFQNYVKGVLTDAAGCGTAVDHAVLAVGYGKDAATGLDYIKIRNSWGLGWGDNGYIRIWADDKANVCNMYSYSFQPVL
jgi:C1A family cysteine protease